MKMRKSMKNLGLTLSLGALAVTAFAASLDESVAQLNGVVTEILSQFQRSNSTAEVKFVSIKTDATRVLDLAAIANYMRTGKTNTLTVKIENLSLKGKDAALAGTIGLDFTKLFTQEQINDLVPGSEELVKDLAKGYTKGFGDAAVVDAKLTETTKDDAGNYTGLKATLSASIDLAKLPPKKKLEDVPFTSAKADLTLVATTGLTATIEVVLNPAFKGFRDGAAIKEALERVLAKNPDSEKIIDGLIKKIDDFAGKIVDGQF